MKKVSIYDPPKKSGIINFIQNWWNDKHCFVRNPFFWLSVLVAGVAAPFTGFLSLMIIPVFAGLAQTGCLPYDWLLANLKKSFLGSSMNKKQIVSQDENDSILNDAEHHGSSSSLRSLSSDSHQSILKTISSASSIEEPRSSPNTTAFAPLFSEAERHQEVLTGLEDDYQIEQNLSDEQKWIRLSDEALFTLALIHKHRETLHLNQSDEQEIQKILQEIPEEKRPLHYSKEEQERFDVCQKSGFSWQETSEDLKRRLESPSGKKMGRKLLVRFSDDKTLLSQYNEKVTRIPFTNSHGITFSRSLQSVCYFLNQLLIRIFVHEKEQREYTDAEPSPSYSWQTDSDIYARCDALDKQIDALRESYVERGKAYDKIIQRHAEMRKTCEEIRRDYPEEEIAKAYAEAKKAYAEANQSYSETKKSNLAHTESIHASWIKMIDEDDEIFSATRKILSNYNYPIPTAGLKNLIDKQAFGNKGDALIKAIIEQDKQLKLTHLCFETTVNPRGFIKTTDIERLFPEEKASKIIQKLTSPQKTGFASFLDFNFSSLLVKEHSGSSYSSKNSSSDEDHNNPDAAPENSKKKATSVAHFGI